jgi:RimJ/RimL family protein N-acetyltransferase
MTPRPLSPDTLRNAPRELRTARLVLQAARADHAPAFLDSLQSSLADWHFIAWAQTLRDLAWAEAFCTRSAASIDAGEDLVFHAFTRDGGRHVGRIDLHSFDFDTPRAEIGYVGDVRLAGQGLMREAVDAVVQLGFSLGLARIHAMSDARNARALRFAAGLGFQREGVLRHWERDAAGSLCDVVMFARCRDGEMAGA